MTILIHAARPVQIDDLDAPTILDRWYAAESSPFALDGIQCDEPTPAECLTDGTDHADGDDAPAPSPRYDVIVNHAEFTDGGYAVIDRETGGAVKFTRWFQDALNLAADLNAEDHPGLGDWWATLGPDAELDARWCLTLAGGRRSAMNLDPSEDSERFS